MSKRINILAIETSCDDTCCSVISDDIILSNIRNTQKVHGNYGGVIPEIASRNHQDNISKVVNSALRASKIKKKDISAISYTYGPGLKGPLLVGSMFAKGFALGLNVPIIAVNHLHGHIIANFIDKPHPRFPFLCLLVSGGNTQIVKVSDYNKFELLGQTLDDAIGEAYDKIGKLLGFKYPGGQKIDYYSQFGNENKFKFPKAHVENYNYSFSGIKTAIKYFLQDKTHKFIKENIYNLCASIQKCLLGMLLDKFILAIKDTKIKDIAISGGVACNNGLRNMLTDISSKMDLNLFIPDPQYCTDNAAMIAKLGYIKYLDSDFSDINIDVEPDLKY